MLPVESIFADIIRNVYDRGYITNRVHSIAIVRNSTWPQYATVIFKAQDNINPGYNPWDINPYADEEAPFMVTVTSFDQAMAILGQVERGFMFQHWSNLRTTVEERQKEKETKV